MYKTLSPGALGVPVKNLQDAIDIAKGAGYDGLEFDVHEVADLIDAHGASHVKKMFCDPKIWPAAFGIPVEFRADEATWRKGLAELPRLAAAARHLGCARTMTWIRPGSDELTYEQNLRFNIERLKPIGEILADHGISFGLEFIGPKTVRAELKYPFIHSMDPMLEMCAQIGPNIGLLLDCYHWHSSGGTVDDILKLHPKQVVYVHVNDAPVGVPVDELMDFERCLPGATGVIDTAGFLGALKQIGYDGPVTPEPFGNPATWGADALRMIWRVAGV
jgi:sugar phosphate isomerase/epimerase